MKWVGTASIGLLVAGLLLSGCSTRIPYQGDLSTLRQALMPPLTLRDQVEALNAPWRIPESFWVGGYSVQLERTDGQSLVCSVTFNLSGAILDQGHVQILVTGREAVIRGGNSEIDAYIRDTINQLSKVTGSSEERTTP